MSTRTNCTSTGHGLHDRDVRLTERRASILDRLQGRERPVHLSDLVERLAVDDRGYEQYSDGDGTALDRLRVELHHVDLPLLTEAGLLEYDPERRRIVPSRTPIGGASRD